MITYAEAFDTMAKAKNRWAVLEQRQAQAAIYECIIVSAWLEGQPHVLAVATSLPDGFLDNPTGRVHRDVDATVWLRLWLRHEQRRDSTGRKRTVVCRPENEGIVL